LSAENPLKGGYETGLRIQLLVGVEKQTKKSRFSFTQDFFAKKRSSTTVVRECPEIDQEKFKRQCIEVVENVERPNGIKAYHLLYSVFWGKEIDMVSVFTFGAPQEEWASVKDVIEIMSHVELIGPNFGKP